MACGLKRCNDKMKWKIDPMRYYINTITSSAEIKHLLTWSRTRH